MLTICLGPFWRVTAECISATTQNTKIEICGSLLHEDIVREANNSVAFSILADETNDISGGIEQMSLGVRFVKLRTKWENDGHRRIPGIYYNCQ